MFAIPSVSVEEDEVCRAASVHVLIDAIEKLDASVGPTHPEWIEGLYGDPDHWRLGETSADDGQSALAATT
jgi:hypothetical protein